MKKYSFGVTVKHTEYIYNLFKSKGFDFIVNKGYWFYSGLEWEEARTLVKYINGGKL